MLKGYSRGMIMAMHPEHESKEPDVRVELLPVDGKVCLIKYSWPHILGLDVESLYRSSDGRTTIDLIPMVEAQDIVRGWVPIV